MDALTLLSLLLVAIAFYLIGRLSEKIRFQFKERAIRKDAAQRSRAVIGGQFSEQLAPYLPDFPYKPTEAKFLGKPIDFLVFEGLDEKKVDRIVFVEVKSGKSALSQKERSVRDAIEAGKVTYEVYRVPDRLTGGRDA